MSDERGAGWWLASDGKWYPPETHPDYRPPSPPTPAPSVAAPAKPKLTGKQWAWALLGVAIPLGLVLRLFGVGNDDPSTAGPTRLDAYSACQVFVERKLKAPSTAKWPRLTSSDVRITGSGNGPWTVVGVVDSENSFGAMLRSSFSCTTRFDAVADKWALIEVTVT